MTEKQGMILFFGIALIILNFWVQGYFHVLWGAIFTGSANSAKTSGSPIPSTPFSLITLPPFNL